MANKQLRNRNVGLGSETLENTDSETDWPHGQKETFEDIASDPAVQVVNGQNTGVVNTIVADVSENPQQGTKCSESQATDSLSSLHTFIADAFHSFNDRLN
jgi:hypothetical protein